MGEVNTEEEGQTYLDLLNAWGEQQGHTPKYTSYEEFRKDGKLNKTKTFKRIKRAYDYFVNGETSQGAKPELSTYFIINDLTIKHNDLEDKHNEKYEDKTNDLNNSKTDFLNNEMSQQVKTFEDFYELTPKVKAKAKAKSGFGNETYRTNYGNAMNRLFETTKSGLKVTHNNKYVNPAYIKDVFLPKHQGWTYKNDEDLDGDEINDVALYDDKNNLRIFNGYQFGPKNYMMEYQNYLQNPETKDFGFKSGFLASRPKKNKTEKPFAGSVKTFVDATYNKFKELIKAENNYALTMQFNNSGFKSKLTSYVNRYVALAFILLADNDYEVNEQQIRSLIFAENKSQEYWTLMRLFRSKKVKELMETNKNEIENAIKQIEVALFKIIDNKKIDFIKSFFAGDHGIPVLFYNVTIQYLNDVYKKEYQKI